MTVRDFHALRSHLGLPPVERTDEFPDAVVTEAEQVAAGPPGQSAGRDLTSIPFVTIDPPDSLDLDQAVHIERAGDGFTVHYAIADLGSAIPPGEAVDTEARRRGQTIYLPDGRVPLHPPVLSEGALSLLPDQTRRAVVWTVHVAADGSLGDATVGRATVRSVARLDYAGVQADVNAGRAHPSIEALADLGRARQSHRIAAGAIDLELPDQQVVADGDGWTIVIEPRTEVDAWNAEVSLLTGMVAARLMIEAKVGILRRLPAPSEKDVAAFGAMDRDLGVGGSGRSPGQVLHTLDPSRPESIALMTQATRLLRGADYCALDGEVPDATTHAGIGGPYAHVTAPLRRLVDRFTTEVCLAVSAGEPVPDWVGSALPEIADRMAESDRRAAEADRTAIDLVETWLMHDAAPGTTFGAIVMRSASGDRPAEVLLTDPPVVSDAVGDGLIAGTTVRVRVEHIDDEQRTVTYRTA